MPPERPSPAARPRVVVFTAHFLHHIDSVEIYSYQLWRRLARRGWEVLLVTSDAGGGPEQEVMEGIQVRRLAALAIMDDRFPIVLPSPALVRAWRALDAFRPAVAVTNVRFMPPCWVGAAYAWRRRIPRLHIEHGSNHVPVASRPGQAASKLLDDTLGRMVVRSATRCVGVSTSAAQFAQSLGASRAGILAMGVEDGPADVEARTTWRRRLEIDAAAKAILFLGRVTEDKGALVLLDAWRRMGPPPDAHLVVVGTGGALPEVQRRASGLPRVRAIGPVAPSEVRSVMSACDIFVHPSCAAEGRPVSVVEAAAAGLSVVSTPPGVEGDLIASEDEGLLVPAADANALAAALERALRDPLASAARAAALRRKVIDAFGWDRVVQRAEEELLATAAMHG